MAFVIENSRWVLRQNSNTIDLADAAKAEGHATYIYDLDGMKERLLDLKSAFSGQINVHYAMKANNHPAIMKLFADLGVGMDVVSGGELKLARDSGVKAADIVFSGVGKTVREIDLALQEQIKQINVESPAELARIAERAKALGVKARIALRMNPDVNPATHPYIKTGFRENKFGMDEGFLPAVENILKTHADHLELKGLTLHIGSQIRDLSPLFEAIDKTIPIYKNLLRAGYPLTTFDIGGGVGINYETTDRQTELESLRHYGEEVLSRLKPLGCEILCEPGRILTAPFGVLLTEIQYIKKTPFKTFAIVDTGMHHLMRPALYQAYHRIEPAMNAPRLQQVYDVVGPICESSDVLGHERLLPELAQGNWLVIFDAGAYGRVMVNDYNLHERPAELAYSQGKKV